MKPERWRQVDELLEAALECPATERASFLDRACAGDEGLRRELESLLISDGQAEAFIESPPARVAADLFTDNQPKPGRGERLAHYEILAPIGSGGMGEVYLAQDTRLGRKVALKLLPPSFTSDAQLRARFFREAQLASALDHPNVCTIHEVGQSSRFLFIAMQYVEGVTLKQLIGSRPLKLDALLSISLQAADALAAAHDQGIIHRDIKSNNIIITPRGQVKVLDFGLAKLTDGSGRHDKAESELSQLTRTGAVMGTPSYMSPEQARGERVDHRSDIFSLGVVIYEMASGVVPFKRKSQTETMNAVINESHTPVAELNEEVPAGLSAAIDRALSKEPADRYQSMGEMLSDLRQVGRAVGLIGSSDSQGAVIPYVPLGHRSAKLFGAIIFGAAAIAALIIWRIQISPDQTQTTGVLRNMQVTTWPGLDVYPTLAPDGNSIAYSSDHNGSFEIYVRPLTPGANEIQITSDGQQNFQPAWSPDGKLIAYYSKKRGGIWEVPASGGTAKQLTEFGSRPAWSPDGSLLAFQSYGLTDLSATSIGAISPSTLWIVPTRGGDPRPVTQIGNPPGGHGAPSWSPDGSRIVFIASDANVSTMWTVSVKENELKRITGSRNWVYDPIYSPDGEHIYYGGVSEQGSFLLYKLRVSRSSGEAVGEPVEVANTGLMRIKNLTISADGKRIAYSAPMMMGGILSIPLSPGSSEATGAPVSLTQGTNYRKGLPNFSPDGRRIAYVDFRGGINQDVWVMDADGKNPLQLTNDPAIDWAPSWFPDNDRIAFQSNRQGRQAFWSISTKSGKETLLVDPGLAIGFPMLSPDGKQIAFNSTKSGTINVWVVPVEGGEPRQLTFDSELAGWPCMSPDGRLIGFQMKRGENTHIMVMPADGGTPTQLTFDQGQSWPHNWSPDGDKIVFAGQRNDVWNVFWVSRATKERKQMTTNSKLNAYVRYPAWSPLGNQIAYEYSESIGNIWLLELK